MIRITKLSDYGTILLSRMSEEPVGTTFSARQIAEETNIPSPMVSKILKALSRGGLLDSKRGVHGGYSLARQPAEITLASIIAALEGPIQITSCAGDDVSICIHHPTCVGRKVWPLVNQQICEYLEKISLVDVLAMAEDSQAQVG